MQFHCYLIDYGAYVLQQIKYLIIQLLIIITNFSLDPSNSNVRLTTNSENFLNMKLSKAQLTSKIQTQTIDNQTIYYSYASKSQATVSFIKNDRLLIFNFNTGMLYYINELSHVPFKTQIPKPKNDCANMNVSIAKNPPDSNELIIQFVIRNQKNQNINTVWTFTFQQKNLVKQWIIVIQSYKSKKIQQMMNAENKKKAQNSTSIKQQRQTKEQPKINNSWIHDTLGFGLMEVPKKPDSKPENKQVIQPENKPPLVPPQNQSPGLKKSVNNQMLESVVKPIKIPEDENQQGSSKKLAESKYERQQQRKYLGQAAISAGQTAARNNLTGSKIVKTLDINPNKSISSSNIQLIKNNLQTKSEIKQSRKQFDPLQMSNYTIKDQLQIPSILQRSNIRRSNLKNSYNIPLNQSRTSLNKQPIIDWNLKFLQNQNEEVLLEYQNYAVKIFMSVLKEVQISKQKVKIYVKPESMIIVTDAQTNDAKKLKVQFRNYHFIMESCKDNFIVGVPLACLIQFNGLVALVQSLIPEAAPRVELTHQIMNQLKDLQRYTRVKNNVLKKAALYDLTDLYQSNEKKLIYINQLKQYLPVHVQSSFKGGLLRPEHLLDNINEFMQGGAVTQANKKDMKTFQDALTSIEQNVRLLAKQLSNQDVSFANGSELKNIMHQRGINLKYLPVLYLQATNKSVKKYIHTFMVSKIAKDYIIQNLSQLKYGLSNNVLPVQLVENSFRLLVEGNSSQSNQLWKEMAIKFKKQYCTPMNHHEISGPFFLNCLLKIIPGKYDLTKLNDKKNFFKDQAILAKGFVAQLHPKLKSFYRYTTQLTDKIMYTCKQPKSKENYAAIVNGLKLSNQPIPNNFVLSKTDEDLKEYMSSFTCPYEFDPASFGHLNIFQIVGQQPPTHNSLSITLSYLKWCLQKQQYSRFKQMIQDSFRILNFWYDSNHIYHCEFLELLSDYCERTGTIDQSIKFMKQSLATCLKNGAGINSKAGQRFYALAEKQMRAGRKNDSLQNFTKAKNIMQSFNNKTSKYPITLIKLSLLYLNNNDFENCVIFSKKAIQKLEELQNTKDAFPDAEKYSIKAIQIITRAYEIQNKKSEFYKIAQQCSAKYNKTQHPQTFQQLIKICLTAVIFKHNQEKCEVFKNLIKKLFSGSQAQQTSAQKCLNQLMIYAEQYNVMQKFMFKFQSLERIYSDVNGRRISTNDSKDFINIVKNVIGVVGEDYVFGLIKQKEFE